MTTLSLLEPTAPNLRAEIARRRLEHRVLARYAGMPKALLSQYLTENKPLTVAAATRIATAFNAMTVSTLFSTEIKA